MSRRGGTRRTRSTRNADSEVMEISDDDAEVQEESERPASRRRTTSSQRLSSQTAPSQPDGGFAALSDEQQDELTQRFVRYMICRHVRKRPVRRQDAMAHVFRNMTNISNKTRVFNGTFQRAQSVLRHVFGFEAKEISRLIRRQNTTQSRTATASQSASQAGPKTTKAYVLVTALQQEIRVQDKGRLAEIGFLMIIACLIVQTAGCRISEEDLHRHLARIGVQVKDRDGHKQLNGGNVKDLLEKEFIEQWYLERELEDNSVFYSMGPRLRAEVSDEDILECIDAPYRTGDEDGTKGLDETVLIDMQQRLDDARGVVSQAVDDEE